MARRGTSGTSTRRTGGSTSRRRGTYTPPAETGGGDWRSSILGFAQGPFARIGERYLPDPLKPLARVSGVITSAPVQALLYPKGTVHNLQSTVTGLWEGPYGFGKSVKDIGLKDTADLFMHGIVQDYKQRYGADWKTHAKDNPLFNVFDMLTVLGASARGAALLGAGERLGAAGETATLRNLWKESSRPGILTGGEKTRHLEFQPETGKLQTAEQPYSRSPLRQATQNISDELAHKFGDAPIFGARSRIARTEGSTMRRVLERTFGKITGEEALNALGEAGRTRLYWEGQLGVESGDNRALGKLRDALAKEWDTPSDVQDPEFAQFLADAKKLGFGKNVVLKRLDDAIAWDPTTGKNKRRYNAARSAMVQATSLAERTIADSDGFASLQQDLKRASDRLDGLDLASPEHEQQLAEIQDLQTQLSKKQADLTTMFKNRRSLLLDWLDTKGDHAHSRAWTDTLTNLVGKDEAQQMIAFTHGMANKIRPDNPESFWADKVGMPDPKDLMTDGAHMFRQRVGEDALFQFADDAGLLDSGFYSPTQKWAVDAPEWGRKDQMNVAQLRAAVRKHGGEEEFHNSGLDMYFDALGNNDIIKKQEFLTLLANRLNAYNLRQVVRINTRDNWERTGLETIFDEGHGGNYISRGKMPHPDGGMVPHDGEYYEVQFELPGQGIDNAQFVDKNRHWGRENVVTHFRFHVFQEDGIKKLLVEEIQSDWASEYRVAREAKRKQGAMSPEMRHAYEEVKVAEREARTELENLTKHRDQLDADIRDAEAGIGRRDPAASDLEGEWYNVIDRIDAVKEDLRQYNRLIEDYDGGTGKPVPTSPLGTGHGKQSSYINSPIRWIGRFAAENGVDEIHLVTRETQLARNAKHLDPRAWHSVREQGAEAVTQWFKDNPYTKDRSFQSYDHDIPDRMAEEWGVKGVRNDAAYEGAYKVPADFDNVAEGRMPATVFKVTEDMKREVMKPKSMYQRSPDWNALPKGAVELFADSKSRIHMFQGGDVSTWIHELGHVALHDLSEEDRLTVEGHFGQGKGIAEWTDMQHEDFARAFEQFVREGIAPTRELGPVFAKLSSWIKAVWEREKRVNQEIPPEVNAIFSKLFHSQNEPDIFIPHRPGRPDLGGGRTTRGIPRANREIGDRTISRIPLFKRNTLALLRSGLINDDPRATMEHANRVVALAKANQLREHVLAMGEPLLPGDYPNFDTQYVVKRAGRGVDKATFDNLETADAPAEIRDTISNYIDDNITDSAKKYEEWKGESQLYVVDKKSVDMLFKYVTGKAPGAATKPASNTMKVADSVLDTFRGLLLYANPGFYITNMLGNTGMMMLKDPRAAKYLPTAMKEAVTAALQPESADPQFHRITAEMGRGPTSGQFSLGSIKDVLSAKPGEKGNLPGRAGEKWSQALGEWGRRSGRVIDDAFRVAAWKQSAAKLGYDTTKKIDDLLDDPSILHPFKGHAMHLESKAEKDLAKIRDEAEQLMLDFDSMSPAERTYLQRAIFLYPFLKASAKYPLMFAGERPITAGALFGATGEGQKFADQALGPRPDLPLWLAGYARGPGGYINIGSLSPFNQPQQFLQTLMSIRGPSEPGVQRPWDYANPVYQMLFDVLRQQNAYGREAPTEQIIKDELPLPAWLRYPLRKPSTQYTNRDFLNTLARSFRVYPTELTAGMGQPEAPARGTGSRRRGTSGSRRRGG